MMKQRCEHNRVRAERALAKHVLHERPLLRFMLW